MKYPKHNNNNNINNVNSENKDIHLSNGQHQQAQHYHGAIYPPLLLSSNYMSESKLQ